MLKTARLIAALTLGASAAPALSAQRLADLCRAASEAKVGQWASFDVSGGHGEGGKLRFAIVGSERRGDSTLYWFEVSGALAKDPSRNGIMQLLVPGPGARATSIHGLIAKVGDQPAVKMPEQMLAMIDQRAAQNNAALAFARHCQTARIVGPETVTVPAGRFATVRLKSDDGEAWLSQAVPFAIVKAIGTDGTVLVLTGHGADAKSSITEQPQELPGMMLRKP